MKGRPWSQEPPAGEGAQPVSRRLPPGGERARTGWGLAGVPPRSTCAAPRASGLSRGSCQEMLSRTAGAG